MRSFKKSKLFYLVLICMMQMVLSACQGGDGAEAAETEQQSQVVSVETIKPSYDTVSVDGSFVGTVETGDVVSVYPQISAQVIAKYHEVGDYVNAGEVLCLLDDRALQIEKRTADATVQSAAATLDAQKANSAAVQAAANESIGTIATNEYEKAKAINEADREANAASVNERKDYMVADVYSGEEKRAKEAVDKLKDQLSSAQKFYNHLNEIRSEYEKIYKDPDKIAAGTNETDAEEYIQKNTKYISDEEFNQALETAKTVVENMEAEKSNQQSNYASSMAQKIEACLNAEIERGNIANAQEAKALAQKMFMDYEVYTKSTILAEANAKVAEGQANVTISDSQLQTAKAAQDLANLQLSYASVVAPISGTIDEINVVQYGMATDQAPAYVITGQANKKISFYVPENVLQKISIGQEVTVNKDNQLFKAAVTRINDNLKQGGTLFKVEAAIQDNGNADFIVGTKVKLETGIDRQENVLTIPIGALYYDDGRPYLFVALNGKAVRKDVETGLANSERIQIVSGIDENAVVITSWSSSLKDQTDIKIVSTGAASKASETIRVEDVKTAEKEAINISRDVNAGMTNESEQTAEPVVMVETTDKVNIRQLPDKSSSKLETVSKGTKFEKISDTDNGWTRIKYNSQEAYIKSDYIKIVQ